LWFAENILDFHMRVFGAAVAATFLIIMPLLIVRHSRPYAERMLSLIIYIVAGTMWFYSAFFCLTSMSMFWFVLGALLFGFGVTPIALIGAAFQHQWEAFFSILIMLVVIGIWKFVYYFANKSVLKEMIRMHLKEENESMTEEEIEAAFHQIKTETNQ
jgi:hypothetical protein